MLEVTTELLTAAAVAAALLGLAVIAIRGRRNPRWVLVDGLLTAAAVGAVALVGGVGYADLTGFGILHLAYLGLTISLPAVAAGWLLMLAVRRRLGPLQVIVGLVLVAPAPVGFYATHLEPFDLRVHRAELTVGEERIGSDTLKVGVMSDIQTPQVTSYEEEAVEAMMDLDPDIVVLTGDFLQSAGKDFDRTLGDMVELLDRLDAPGGVYAVPGDTDTDEVMARIAADAGITVLTDEVVETSVGDRVVRIGGNRLDYESPEAAGARSVLAADGTPEAIRILVAHRPDVVLSAEPGEVELVVAGHTHGGQVVLPWVGPPFTLTDVPDDVAAGGLHAVDGVPVYVSTGIGVERGQAPQVRFLSPPSIGLIEIVG